MKRSTMQQYRIAPGTKVDLSAVDAAETSGFDGGKREAKDELKRLVGRLADLQHLMWAEDRHKLLVVLQAMDSGGKDGTIRRVFGGVNPQGVRVTNFKAPTDRELEHDYLWRIHAHTPGNGEIAVFNRSHYEDVLIVRVLGLVPAERWQRRYDHIRAFEQLLAEEGTTIVKFYLHISRDEQKERFQERLDDPTKNWKFNPGDLDHRARWDEYMAAFEAALERTSTESAPWYVVPADRKWYRNLVVARTLVETLEGLGMEYPDPEVDVSTFTIG
jgi:PPK2 family polyphosphate:nucleotide phosphotransferase